MLRDLFKVDENFEFLESKSEVDGTHVLGKIRGQFFFPDGVSRNKRFYPKSLWEKVLNDPEVQEKLKNKQMFGTISHSQKLDDEALLNGKMSHIVTKLWIDKNKGMGEALILNTPAGQILNTVLRAGAQLHTSTRATGDYKGKYEGMPMVDPDKYKFSTVDVVLDPGFTDASADLAESINKLNELDKILLSETKKDVNLENINNNNNNKSISDNKGEIMDTKLFEKTVNENSELKANLSIAGSENKTLKEKNETLEKELKELKASLSEKEEKEKLLESYEAIGTSKDISEKMAALQELEKEYNAIKETLGTKEEIEKALSTAKDFKVETDKFHENCGSQKEIEEALDVAKKVILERKEFESKFGTNEEIEEAFSVAKKTILEYQELGTVEEIKQVFEKSREFLKERKEKEDAHKINKLAEELNVSVDSVKALYGKVEESVIRDVLSKTSESSKISERYRKRSEEKPVEKKEAHKAFSKSRVSRMNESLCR